MCDCKRKYNGYKEGMKSIGRATVDDLSLVCANGDKICVLVIDDDHSFLDLMECALTSSTIFNVTTVDNLEDARTLFAPGLFMIVTVDLVIPPNSIEDIKDFLQFLRAVDPYIEIVVCTGFFFYCNDLDLLKCVDHFLEKPFDITSFSERVLSWLTHFHQRREQTRRIDERFTDIESRISNLDELSHRVAALFEEDADG